MQDVANLGGFREWVKVRRGCGVAGGARSMVRGFADRVLRRSVRVERCNALRSRSCGAVDNSSGSLDGCTRPGVGGVRLLADGLDFLSALQGVAGYDSQLVHGQLEVASRGRHALRSRHQGATASGSPVGR